MTSGWTPTWRTAGATGSAATPRSPQRRASRSVAAAHQPHYQSRDYNPLNGGIARWFEPVLPEIGAGASMTTILATCRALFERLPPARAWHIEVHQFRIEARSGRSGDRRRKACTATAWTTCWCC